MSLGPSVRRKTRAEAELRATLEAAASDLRLDLAPARFAVNGVVRSSKISARLDASDRYRLLCTVGLPVVIPDGSCVARRRGMWSKLAMLAGVDRPTKDAAFNAAFEVRGAFRNRLTPSATSGILALAQAGEVRIDEEAVTYRTASLDVSASGVLKELVAIAEAVGAVGGCAAFCALSLNPRRRPAVSARPSNQTTTG